MCNLSEGIERKGMIKGYAEVIEECLVRAIEKGIIEGEEARKLFAYALTSYMISRFGYPEEFAEEKTNYFISRMDKDSSLFM